MAESCYDDGTIRSLTRRRGRYGPSFRRRDIQMRRKDETHGNKNQPYRRDRFGHRRLQRRLKMQQMLPHENLLYFGDGGNMPYGNHSQRRF